MKDKKIISFCVDKLDKIETTASKGNLFYVVCFWNSPITQDINYRVGYFEDIVEADSFSKFLQLTYTRFQFPYVIYSNISSIEKDGGLLNDHSI